MSKKYDHHWKKGLPGKKGIPMELPSANAMFWRKYHASEKRRKRRIKAAAEAKERLARMSHPTPQPIAPASTPFDPNIPPPWL